MSITRSEIKLLATDYDNCAFHPEGDHEHLLSALLIEHVNSQHYDGFYGLTHRCYYKVNLEMEALLKAKEKKSTDPETTKIANNYFTHQITAHFSKVTKLPCIAVSMLDDLKHNECGYSFENIIKPFEQDPKKRPAPHLIFTEDDITKFEQSQLSKNQQLLQVAKHAANKYPNCQIQLDFVDDRLDLCMKALSASKQPEWPANVSLSVYRHDARTQSKVISFGSKKDSNSKQDQPKNITVASLFNQQVGIDKLFNESQYYTFFSTRLKVTIKPKKRFAKIDISTPGLRHSPLDDVD